MSFEDKITTLKTSLVPAKRRQAAEELLREIDEIDHDVIKVLCESLSDNDKGVRDVIATGLTQLEPQWNDTICQYLSPFIRSERIEIRNLVTDILLKIKPTNIFTIAHYFDDPNPDNVKFAIDIAGLIAPPDYLELIFEKIDHADSNVRCSVIEAIGNIYQNYPENNFNRLLLIERFEALYWSDEDLKPFIIESLGKVGGEESQNFLISLINNESNFFMRVAAVDGLAICGTDIGVCFKLLDLFESVNDELKVLFLKTIFAISFRVGESIELPSKYRYVAQLALMENDPDTYGAGLVALGSNYTKEDVPYLLKVVFRNDSDVNHFMIRNLVHSEDQVVIEEFVKQLFLKYDPSDTENLDFLSFISVEAATASPVNKEVLIKSLIKNTINQKPIYWENIITYCLEISNEITIKELQKMYNVSDTSELNYINDILNKFDITF